MVLKKIIYFVEGKKHTVNAKKVFFLSPGLMFRRKSPPLLFTLPKEMTFPIGSIFCKPFKAIWLDKNMNATNVIDVKTWKYKINGRGKYLLEIPLRKSPSEKQ